MKAVTVKSGDTEGAFVKDTQKARLRNDNNRPFQKLFSTRDLHSVQCHLRPNPKEAAGLA